MDLKTGCDYEVNTLKYTVPSMNSIVLAILNSFAEITEAEYWKFIKA